MATWVTADHTAASEAPTMDGPAGEQLLQTPDRRHVDNLLDISEEGFLKDLEPHEHHPYSGWEEAVSMNLNFHFLHCVFQTKPFFERKPNNYHSTHQKLSNTRSKA